MGLLDGAGYLIQFMREQWKAPEEIARIQERRLANALQDAYKAGHYRRLMDEAGLRPHGGVETLGAFPLTTKEAIQSHPESFLVQAGGKSAPVMHETTGSTGVPMQIYMDRRSATMRSAMQLFNLLSCGLMPSGLTAQLAFTGAGHPLGRGRTYGILPTLSLDILESEEKNLDSIRRSRADALGYYPSATTLIAKANLESVNPIRLGRVLSGAELLAPDWRRLLEESFSCPVFNLYGCWEFGPVAFECPEEHSMHVNSGTFYMEILDSHGRQCKGGMGKVALTSLCNGTMPLVRYELGDVASWGGECACGRGLPVIKSLEGRSDDMVILPSGRMRSPLSYRFTDLKGFCREIRMFQLVQEEEGLFVFRFVSSPAAFSEPLKNGIESRIREASLGEPVRIEFEEAAEIKRNRRGKLDRLVSKVSRRRPMQSGGGVP